MKGVQSRIQRILQLTLPLFSFWTYPGGSCFASLYIPCAICIHLFISCLLHTNTSVVIEPVLQHKRKRKVFNVQQQIIRTSAHSSYQYLSKRKIKKRAERETESDVVSSLGTATVVVVLTLLSLALHSRNHSSAGSNQVASRYLLCVCFVN